MTARPRSPCGSPTPCPTLERCAHPRPRAQSGAAWRSQQTSPTTAAPRYPARSGGRKSVQSAHSDHAEVVAAPVDLGCNLSADRSCRQRPAKAGRSYVLSSSVLEKLEELPGYVALETPLDFPVRLAFGPPALGVGTGGSSVGRRVITTVCRAKLSWRRRGGSLSSH